MEATTKGNMVLVSIVVTIMQNLFVTFCFSIMLQSGRTNVDGNLLTLLQLRL